MWRHKPSLYNLLICDPPIQPNRPLWNLMHVTLTIVSQRTLMSINKILIRTRNLFLLDSLFPYVVLIQLLSKTLSFVCALTPPLVHCHTLIPQLSIQSQTLPIGSSRGASSSAPPQVRLAFQEKLIHQPNVIALHHIFHHFSLSFHYHILFLLHILPQPIRHPYLLILLQSFCHCFHMIHLELHVPRWVVFRKPLRSTSSLFLRQLNVDEHAPRVALQRVTHQIRQEPRALQVLPRLPRSRSWRLK